ncbi:MAG: hypothetical protein H6R04_461 [Burkholderiaceae bacterium]|nr:hypothetical protein [Burkholderiaceae bacterium]
MPISVQWEDGGVLATIAGKLTLGDYHTALKIAWLDHRYNSVRYIILDAKNQKIGSALSKWELEALAFFAKGVFKEMKFAVAVVVNPANHASVSAAECYNKIAVHPHAIFMDMAEARNWVQTYLEKQ